METQVAALTSEKAHVRAAPQQRRKRQLGGYSHKRETGSVLRTARGMARLAGHLSRLSRSNGLEHEGIDG